MKTVISEELYQYALECGANEHPILAKISNYNAGLPNGHMQVAREQAQFMVLLAKLMNAKRYLEVGVFTGYSSLAMAIGMGSGASIIAIDNNEANINIAKRFWKEAQVDSQIKVYLGDATEQLEVLCTDKMGYVGTFDIAFIDANKSGYLEHYNYCLKLIREGGAVIIDNTLMHGLVIKDNPPAYVRAIQNFNQAIKNDPQVDMVVLPFADGITIAYKKFIIP